MRTLGRVIQPHPIAVLPSTLRISNYGASQDDDHYSRLSPMSYFEIGVASGLKHRVFRERKEKGDGIEVLSATGSKVMVRSMSACIRVSFLHLSCTRPDKPWVLHSRLLEIFCDR